MCVRIYGKPWIENPSPESLREWVERNNVAILNVAGNRENTNPGICQRTSDTIYEAFREVSGESTSTD